MSSLLDVDDVLAPEKRPRVGRSHEEILASTERDIEDSPAGKAARELLIDAGASDKGETLAGTLQTQASQLDAKFVSDPQAVIAAVLEA